MDSLQPTPRPEQPLCHLVHMVMFRESLNSGGLADVMLSEEKKKTMRESRLNTVCCLGLGPGAEKGRPSVGQHGIRRVRVSLTVTDQSPLSSHKGTESMGCNGGRGWVRAGETCVFATALQI